MEKFEFQKPIKAEQKTTVATLRKILLARKEVQEQLEQKIAELEVAATEARKEAIEDDIQELRARLDDQERDFESIATGIDLEHFTAKPSPTFDWKKDLQEISVPSLKN
jgi:hypothetical protein